MQAQTHPTLHTVNVICTCGNKFDIRTTKPAKQMHIEVCLKCHSAYTGKRKLARAGAIEKFQKKFKAYSSVLDSNKDN